MKACVAALKEFPAVNAEIDGDDIVYKNYYDIGVAVGSPHGLVVPVVRDADKLALRRRSRRRSPTSASGPATASSPWRSCRAAPSPSTNGGVFGSLLSTPILNPPQSGILGMHKIQQRPVVVDGKIEARPMMYLALSYDHRIIDGREAVTLPRPRQGSASRTRSASCWISDPATKAQVRQRPGHACGRGVALSRLKSNRNRSRSLQPWRNQAA